MGIIEITEEAQTQAKQLLDRDNPEKSGLRLKVIGGGCSGLQYQLGFDNCKEEDLEIDCANGLRVFIDPKSAPLIAGSTLVFHNDLNKSGFEVQNPNANSTCGCGQSFS